MRLAVPKPGIQTGRRGQGKAVPGKRREVCVCVAVVVSTRWVSGETVANVGSGRVGLAKR